MIDLVEQARPSDLESAGEALQKARDAIAAAAGELGAHIDRVDWEGEAGQAFRKWGKNLVKDTHKLSDFADAASVHLASAGAGLASVRASMPPRDDRADPKAVKDIPARKRVDGNEDFRAAVKAEQHRQEAINQMNRLASFYLVSQDGMARQEPPAFSAMPNVGVPELSPGWKPWMPGETQGNSPSAAAAAPHGPASSLDPAGSGPGSGTPETKGSSVAPEAQSTADDALPSGHEVRGPIESPSCPVGTEIDSVGTLPPQTTGPAAGPPSAPLPPVPPESTLVAPWGGGRVQPGPTTSPPPGRPGAGGPRGVYEGSGRAPGAPTGRAAPVGPIAQGRSGNAPTAPGQPPVGRSVTGGTPRSIGAPSPHSGAPHTTGAQRTQGVVGGRPVSNALSGPPGASAPRSHAAGGTTGVIGTPKDRAPGGGGRRSGFTAGGTGLARRTAAKRQRSDRENDESTQKPGEEVQGDETRLPGERRHVPPVID
ncbi:hypothetical protein ABZ383_14750 [Streptomyces sp. NPDC005900]|uniref:hypothetical protein n=1 Tax=Streptomyces sp. NPDC005900 TaxID=3154569 RepID=UPI00340C7237